MQKWTELCPALSCSRACSVQPVSLERCCKNECPAQHLSSEMGWTTLSSPFRLRGVAETDQFKTSQARWAGQLCPASLARRAVQEAITAFQETGPAHQERISLQKSRFALAISKDPMELYGTGRYMQDESLQNATSSKECVSLMIELVS